MADLIKIADSDQNKNKTSSFKRLYLLEAGDINPELDAGARADKDFAKVCGRAGLEVEIVNLSKQLDLAAYVREREGPGTIFASSRPGAGLKLASLEINKSKTIYLGHDLHFQRFYQARKLDLEGAPSEQKIQLIRRSEAICWRKHDLSLYPSIEEVEWLRLNNVNASYWPYFLFTTTQIQPSSRSEMGVFIGSYMHYPNQVGLRIFLDRIWPVWLNTYPKLRLNIIGNWPRYFSTQFASSGLNWLGSLSEKDVTKVFRQSGWSVVPLTFGAGVKRKFLQALSHGLYVLSTPVGIQGLPEAPPLGCQVAELDAWPDLIREILEKQSFTKSLQNINYIERNYGEHAMINALKKILGGLG
jgi:hypothetical protein